MTFVPNSTPLNQLLEEEQRQYTKPHRILIFGGSFDPIHNGHILLANAMLEHDRCDEVLFVPARLQPLKAQGAAASEEDRVEMLKLAMQENDKFAYSDIELQRKDEPSYMFDTMSILTRIFPDCSVTLLLGTDNLKDLHKWHRAQELVNTFNFIIYPRPGFMTFSLPVLEEHFGRVNATKLINAVLPEDEYALSPVSSTQIRDLARRGKSLASLVPASVEDYIRTHNLYL